MCLSPISIKNKGYAPGGKARIQGITNREFTISETAKRLTDYESTRMNVPCGVCKQCIAIAQMELIERVQMESLNNIMFMGTLTYKNNYLPRIELPEYEDRNGYLQPGYKYRYAKYEDASLMMKRLREHNTFEIPFKYLIVTERGSKRARPHFHIIQMFPKSELKTYNDILNFEQKHKWTLLENWKRNLSHDKFNPLYVDLCEYVESWSRGKLRKTYDWHYVNPLLTKGGATDAAFYVLKYMMKAQQELDTKRALLLNYGEDLGTHYWNKFRNRREYSLGFGLNVDWSKAGKDRTIKEEMCDQEIVDYLRKGVQRSIQERHEYAYYYCPENLNTFPLANYYKRYPFIYDNDLEFYEINPERYRKSIEAPDRLNESEINNQINKFEEILKLQEMEDIADDFDYLLNL